MIWCHETRFFLWNTNNIGRNGVNKQQTHAQTHPHTHTKHSEKDNTGNGLKKKVVFLVSTFLIFVLNRFAMLHVFYKQLRLGDSTESCLWLWMNSHLKGCLILVV